ncbi:mycofactocin dehydrogenase MftG [Mycolicibacillus trivialis]|uniref:mycofactocin dehydrogenase MftG n=1 Tax=Mycolicibacillus trivialis TaxID=1798 RepID=UPI001A984BA8|nr:mycofactocin system GMC family oxidoreductase MftG [Mycolicibacillus trivialis]
MVDAFPACDVLIVGAGSAGSVVAALLSADPDCAVTVLEAGTRRAPRAAHRLPVGADSELVHRYRTRLTDDPVRWATIMRGATLGGSGAVNGGYFGRSVRDDFTAGALPGWRWEEILQHYRAIETDLDYSGPAHGDCGPIKVRREREFCDETTRFISQADKCGYRWLDDLNDAGPELPTGVGAVPQNIVDGRRIDPGYAYLQAALDRPNLTLHTGTKATQLRIERNRVTAVHAIGPNGPVTLRAKRIVLCAGTIETAHLLMLSGIGDEKVLRSAGVAVKTVLPVGRACTDHPEWLFPTDQPGTPGRAVLEAVLSTAEGIEIRPYTVGFATMTGDDRFIASSGRDPAHVGVALMRPRSRARIGLDSADPAAPPVIEHRYDQHPADLAELAGGAELLAELTGTALPEPAWATSQHLCGSAPMGQVVDERCRVYGVDGLWVIDGSVPAGPLSRGPHATIAMIAHRAAGFVAADGAAQSSA